MYSEVSVYEIGQCVREEGSVCEIGQCVRKEVNVLRGERWSECVREVSV